MIVLLAILAWLACGYLAGFIVFRRFDTPEPGDTGVAILVTIMGPFALMIIGFISLLDRLDRRTKSRRSFVQRVFFIKEK